MICPKCKSEIKEDLKFCVNCGEALPQMKKCVGCEALIKESALFCTKCGTKQPILQEKNDLHREVNKKKDSQPLKMYIGILSIVIIVCIIVGKCLLVDSPSNGKRSFQDIQMTKYFVNDANKYYKVDIKMSWPESLENGDVKPLQIALIKKIFGYSKKNIDEALNAYFISLGKEIERLPEWNGTFGQENIYIVVKEECYVKGAYSSFSISYMNMAERGSIHAAEVINRFVNYDIQNKTELSTSDILNDKMSHTEILDVLKRNSSGEWSNVIEPNEIPKEILLTDSYISFPFDGWQPRIENITIYLHENIISNRVKDLFLDK